MSHAVICGYTYGLYFDMRFYYEEGHTSIFLRGEGYLGHTSLRKLVLSSNFISPKNLTKLFLSCLNFKNILDSYAFELNIC